MTVQGAGHFSDPGLLDESKTDEMTPRTNRIKKRTSNAPPQPDGLHDFFLSLPGGAVAGAVGSTGDDSGCDSRATGSAQYGHTLYSSDICLPHEVQKLAIES